MLWILCCLIQVLAYGVKASECTLPSVEDICVYGNDKSFIPDGATFEFFVYDATTKANVYFCEECVPSSVSSAYLYACISSNTNDYYWQIGSDYQSCSAWSSCYVGNSLGPNYNFDINSCLNTNKWRTYNTIEWENDIDMSLSICNPICYETDIYPQTTTKTMYTKIDTSISWNGDLYFDFNIYEEDCMNPKLSFEYELIDYYDTYKNIQIYNDNDTLIETCDFILGASCGTFYSCFIDYYIDDIIQTNETYSIMIHQTANVNNLCGDYIFNSVLTFSCIPDNIINNKINITTSKTTLSSALSSTLANQDVKRDFFNVISITTIITCTSIIVIVIGCCVCYWYYCCKKYEKKYIKDKADKADKDAKAAKEQQKAIVKMVIRNNAALIHDEEQKKAFVKMMIVQNSNIFQDEIKRSLGLTKQ